jgi:hypothetical protein
VSQFSTFSKFVIQNHKYQKHFVYFFGSIKLKNAEESTLEDSEVVDSFNSSDQGANFDFF